jgi:hypothetical protein
VPINRGGAAATGRSSSCLLHPRLDQRRSGQLSYVNFKAALAAAFLFLATAQNPEFTMLSQAKLQTILCTSRMDAAQQFYSEVLGLPFKGKSHGALVYDVSGGDLLVSAKIDLAVLKQIFVNEDYDIGRLTLRTFLNPDCSAG